MSEDIIKIHSPEGLIFFNKEFRFVSSLPCRPRRKREVDFVYTFFLIFGFVMWKFLSVVRTYVSRRNRKIRMGTYIL